MKKKEKMTNVSIGIVKVASKPAKLFMYTKSGREVVFKSKKDEEKLIKKIMHRNRVRF